MSGPKSDAASKAKSAAASKARSAAASKEGRSILRGFGWMVVTGFFFVAVTGIVRHLGSDMNPMQAAFIRYLMGLILLSPILFRLSIVHIMSARLGLHAIRGVIHGTGVMLWFYAMARIPIAEVTALGFTAPIFTTVGAALFLGERLYARRIGAVLFGFGGTLVILRPGIEVIDLGAIAMLIAAPLLAGSFLIAKRLTATESSASIVAIMSVFVTLTLAPLAIAVWRPPTWEELGLLLATAIFATSGHYTLIQAIRAADLSVTQPISFLQLVWATLLGLYAFGEVPDAWTWVGAAIIVGSATYIAHREATRRRRDPD
jgi:drug/metabolite transporter (DMT)-like permease